MFKHAWVLLAICAAARGLDHRGHLRVEPYTFAHSSRMGLQTQQSLSNMALEIPWSLAFHLELDTKTQTDRSFDVDRAWFRMTSASRNWGEWTWGRIHPWEISLHPSAHRPWGLDGSLQAQNHGALLGAGMDSSVAFPSPMLYGWLGVHYWSDPSGMNSFQWGVSLAPWFVPSRASSLEFAHTHLFETTVFSKSFGTMHTTEGAVPIRYEPNQGPPLLAQPQVMVQSYTDWNDSIGGFESWFWISQAPQATPRLDLQDLQVYESANGKYVVANTSFPRRWMAGTTHQWTLENLRGYSFFLTGLYQDHPRFGFEIGARNRYIRISYLNELKGDGSLSSINDRYTGPLIQYEGHYRLGNFTPYWGAKHHLKLKDGWFRTGVRANFSSDTEVDIGIDVFAASAGAYFDDWKDNDRIFASLVWNLPE